MTARLLVLFALTLLVACGPGDRRRGIGDDDETADDDASDDDDSADDDDATDDDDAGDDDDTGDLGPYGGEWLGTVNGSIRFGTVEYTCAGQAVVQIDQFSSATGTLSCPLVDNPDQDCDVLLPKVGLGLDGPEVDHNIPCTGAMWPGSLAIITKDFLQGEIAGVAFDSSLEIEVEVDYAYSLFR